MQKILLIVGNYSPHPSSVGITIRPLIVALQNEGYSVSVITNNSDKNFNDYEIIDNVKIYRIFDSRVFLLNKVANTFRNFPSVIWFLRKAINFIFLIFLGMFSIEKNYIGWNLKRIYKQIEKLIDVENFDQVISISLPFKSHLAVLKYKKKYKDKIEWIVYEFDPLALNETNKDNHYIIYRKKRIEKKVLETSDKIFLTPELYDAYKNNEYSEFENKMYSIPYATLVPAVEKPEKNNLIVTRKISCVFSGRLYKDIRNPKPVIELFNKIGNFEMTFITDESGRKLIEEFHPKENIKILPFMSFEENKKMVMESDILINIGNATQYQVPGKLFELLSLGKPIIHFSSGVQDASLKYLKKYPLALVIDPNIDTRKQIESINNFSDNFKKILSNEEIYSSMGEFTNDKATKKFLDSLK